MSVRCPNCWNINEIEEKVYEADTKQKRIEMTFKCICGWASRPKYEKWSHIYEN